MQENTKHIILKLLRKSLWVLLVLCLLDVIYYYGWYKKDLQNECSLMELSQIAVDEDADIVYLAESSNHTLGIHDTDTGKISDMIARQVPQYKVSSLTKDACHAGIYYDVLRNIDPDSHVKMAIVTVNMRSFSSEWIHSDLETPLQKEQIFMKKAPALYKRLLIAFKAYWHCSEQKRSEIVRRGIKKQKYQLPYDSSHHIHTAHEWDMAIGRSHQLYDGRIVSDDTVALVCHYVKDFAYQLNDKNPRIKDLDRIVKLCEKRGWIPVFNILADNMDEISDLVGPDLVYLMQQNAQYIIQRYEARGVIVVNNQNVVRDQYFRDREFPTEHYTQEGRQAIADGVVAKIASVLNVSTH